jgi:hypothetical protein
MPRFAADQTATVRSSIRFQEAVMAGSFDRRFGATARRASISTIAIAGIGAAVAVTVAVPVGANATPAHQSRATHQMSAKHHAKRLVVNGVVAGHHGREMTVFARTAKVGGETRHNERLELRFDRDSRGKAKVRTGDRVHLTATGTATGRHFRIERDQDETVSTDAATLFFGSVTAVNGDLLTVAEHDRDNGDRADGDDHGHGQDGDGDGDGGNDHAKPADHSPGGPGDGGGNNNSGHQIVIDDTAATITVDGNAGAVAVGDTVAVLGEATDNTVMASTVWAFSTPPAFLRGDITAISGDNVTIGDNDDHDNVARDHGGDNDNPITVSLTGVPLALNGDTGATTSQLAVGEKLLVIGSVDATTHAFTPTLAFAFNDNDNNPCGDNDHHGHGGDGGSDG